MSNSNPLRLSDEQKQRVVELRMRYASMRKPHVRHITALAHSYAFTLSRLLQERAAIAAALKESFGSHLSELYQLRLSGAAVNNEPSFGRIGQLLQALRSNYNREVQIDGMYAVRQ